MIWSFLNNDPNQPTPSTGLTSQAAPSTPTVLDGNTSVPVQGRFSNLLNVANANRGAAVDASQRLASQLGTRAQSAIDHKDYSAAPGLLNEVNYLGSGNPARIGAALTNRAGTGYTPGAARFDAFLMASTPDAQRPLQELQSRYSGLLQTLSEGPPPPMESGTFAPPTLTPAEPPPPAPVASQPLANPTDARSHLPTNPNPMVNPMDGASHGQLPWGTSTKRNPWGV